VIGLQLCTMTAATTPKQLFLITLNREVPNRSPVALHDLLRSGCGAY
jgi:hypothetical protein